MIDFGESATTRARFGSLTTKVGHVPDPVNQFDREYQWSAVIPTFELGGIREARRVAC